MKKNLLALSLILFMGTNISLGGTIFDSYSQDAADIQKINLSPVKDQTKENIRTNVEKTSKQLGQIQKENFESAIQNLDSAQVEIRDELAQYTQKYNEALGRYNVSKEECKALKSQIRMIKNKIKTIERTKGNINKQIIKYYDN